MDNTHPIHSSFDELLRYRQFSDASCKMFLGDKLILACILKACACEFKDCHVNDIETKYIEGEPEIGTVGVHPETTNRSEVKKTGRIHGISGESVTDSEGKVTFDIRFYAMTPASERVKLIINVEAQNEFYPGYPLIKRGIYYACRQVSAQYGVEFDHADYKNIKKVYSIWVCFDPPAERRNTINKYQYNESHLLGEFEENVDFYDLVTVVMICLGTKKDKRYTGLVKLLDVFMSEVSDLATKCAVLKDEFGADIPERLRMKEENMCNYSEFVMNRGRREGKEEGKAESLINLKKKLKMSIEQAMDILDIPEGEWDNYRELVTQLETQPAQ